MLPLTTRSRMARAHNALFIARQRHRTNFPGAVAGLAVFLQQRHDVLIESRR